MSITLVRCTVVSCAFNHCHFTAGLSPPLGLCARQAVCLRTRECRPKATRHRAPRTQSRSAHCRDSAVGRRALVFVNVVQGNAPSHASRSVVAALRRVPAAASPCARAHVSIAHKRRATTSCAHNCSHHVASLCALDAPLRAANSMAVISPPSFCCLRSVPFGHMAATLCCFRLAITCETFGFGPLAVSAPLRQASSTTALCA